MQYWLAKTEPEEFSYQDLEAKGRERWNGVRNFVALKFLRNMAVGDRVFVYHTGAEKAIVGVAEVITAAYPDPAEQDNRYIVVDLRPLYRLARPVTLREVKQESRFADWELVRQPRLSVMPVPVEFWRSIEALSRQPAPAHS